MDLIEIFLLGVFIIAAELWLLKTRPTGSRVDTQSSNPRGHTFKESG